MGGLANNRLGLISIHVGVLTKLLTELPKEDHASAVSLRSSLVQSSTAIAELHDLVSRISPEPLATDHRRRSVAALMGAIDVVHQLGQEDLTAIGLFFGVRHPNRANIILE